MSRKDLPNFLIYQANPKEFHICLEAGDKFLRWCSYYPPTLDVRYPRALTKIEDMPLYKAPRNKIVDEGSYTVTKSDTRESIESKITTGVKMKPFSFILYGKKLQGRFSIKKNLNNVVLQKFKDKFAVEEDVLSGDLARTISTMIPDYDAKKVKLNRETVVKPAKTRQPEVQHVELPPVELPPVKIPPVKIPPVKIPPVEEVTPEKTIDGIAYHFARYTSKNEPDICLVTSAKGEVMVLKKEKNKWVMQTPLVLKLMSKDKRFVAHANLLYKSDD